MFFMNLFHGNQYFVNYFFHYAQHFTGNNYPNHTTYIKKNKTTSSEKALFYTFMSSYNIIF